MTEETQHIQDKIIVEGWWIDRETFDEPILRAHHVFNHPLLGSGPNLRTTAIVTRGEDDFGEYVQTQNTKYYLGKSLADLVNEAIEEETCNDPYNQVS